VTVRCSLQPTGHRTGGRPMLASHLNATISTGSLGYYVVRCDGSVTSSPLVVIASVPRNWPQRWATTIPCRASMDYHLG